ncbi:hypothetical protein PybrP1_006380, partial [[Pythium] brassicae (nom. inval.)]
MRDRLIKPKRAAAVAKIEAARQREAWHAFEQQQSIKQLWDKRNSVVHYQQWVVYRLSVHQLNLFHAGRAETSECPLNARCRRRKETLQHLMPRGNGSWRGGRSQSLPKQRGIKFSLQRNRIARRGGRRKRPRIRRSAPGAVWLRHRAARSGDGASLVLVYNGDDDDALADQKQHCPL